MTDNYKYALGIDLGTCCSVSAIFKNNAPEVIANDLGNRIFPSYVAFNGDERLVGESAKNQAPRNPKNTIYDAKRFIGRRFSDPEIQKLIKTYPFKVVSDGNDKPQFEVEYMGETKRFYPEEISAMVLSKIKEYSEKYLGRTINDCVITCPAYFSDNARNATRDSGIIAGFNVLRVINEPTAAALSFGFKNIEDKEKNIMVFDLGGKP